MRKITKTVKPRRECIKPRWFGRTLTLNYEVGAGAIINTAVKI